MSSAITSVQSSIDFFKVLVRKVIFVLYSEEDSLRFGSIKGQMQQAHCVVQLLTFMDKGSEYNEEYSI